MLINLNCGELKKDMNQVIAVRCTISPVVKLKPKKKL